MLIAQCDGCRKMTLPRVKIGSLQTSPSPHFSRKNKRSRHGESAPVQPKQEEALIYPVTVPR